MTARVYDTVEFICSSEMDVEWKFEGRLIKPIKMFRKAHSSEAYDKWKFTGERLPPNANTTGTPDSQTYKLYIHKVQLSNIGAYKCHGGYIRGNRTIYFKEQGMLNAGKF